MRKDKILEAYLMVGARSGDRAALARLVELRGPRLLAHAARLLGEREGLRDETAFLPWALRIVTRRVARVIQGRQKDRKLAGEFTAEAETCTPETGTGAVVAVEVRRAIAKLPPEQAATIALFYLEDMRVTEVALALDVPVGTIKTRLMHARTKLRAELKGNENG